MSQPADAIGQPPTSASSQTAGQRRFRRAGRLLGGPRRFRWWLEYLGPTFIKIGQYLALRPDLIPQEYCDELIVLFDRVEPFPWEQARRIIAEELGDQPETIFAAIDPVPIAAGSLAQAHLARLDDGTEVIVKVQRPGIRQQVLGDLRRARLLARMLELGNVELVITPRQIVDEVSAWLLQELDFEHELANITLLRRLAAGSRIEVIPRPYPALCTQRVLTMELVRGIPMSDLLIPEAEPGVDPAAEAGRAPTSRDRTTAEALAEIDREAVAANLITATLRQVFRYQFFHADLHPGNLFVVEGDLIGYVDFGLCDSWDGLMRGRLLRYLQAVYSAEVEQMYRALSEILTPSERTDMAAFRADFFAESRRWTSRMRTSGESRTSPSQRDERSPIAQWMIAVMQLARTHGLRVPPMVVSIYRALLVAETVANRLDAQADLRSVGRKFFEQLQIDEVRRAFEPSSIQPVLLDHLTFMRDSPGQVNQILTALADGNFGLTVYTAEPPRVARARNRRVRVVVTSVLSIGTSVLLTRADLPELQGVSLAWPLAVLLLLLYLSVFIDLRRLR
jgi:ubiquinone biosynthesis protein